MSTPRDGEFGLPLVPPVGMRDFVYPESAERADVGRVLLETFARYGYDLVVTPPFEHQEVIERAMDDAARADLLRFVDPQTGDVAVLRADFTPQIARLIAAHFHDRPGPWRLAYRGTVIRRRRGRARKHRQVVQAGIECVGVGGPDGDIEALNLCTEACVAAGLSNFRVEINHVSVPRALLAEVPERYRPGAQAALARKDRAELERNLAGAKVPARTAGALLELPSLLGGLEVLDAADKLLPKGIATTALHDVRALVAGAESAGYADRLLLDLSELRGMSYYTGASFAVLADGPGEPIAAGGRYDNLLGRFDVPAPATGFAIDIGNLVWARSQAGHRADPGLGRARFVVSGPGAESIAASIRGAGHVAAVHATPPAANFLRAWGYDAEIAAGAADGSASSNVTRVDGASRPWKSGDEAAFGELVRWAKEL